MPSTDKYHPYRYARLRSFAKQIKNYWESEIHNTNRVTEAHVKGIQKIVQRGYNDYLQKLPLEKRPDNADLLFTEINRAFSYGAYCVCGRNVFDFDTSLVEMLRNTSIDKVPANVIQLPYDSFYLGFGVQEDMPIGTGRYVDGAYIYVQRFTDRVMMHIDLSTAPLSGEDMGRSFIESNDLRYHLSFAIETDRHLNEIVEEALSEEKEQQKPTEKYQEEFRKAQEDAEKRGLQVSSQFEEGSRRRNQAMVEGYPVFRKALSLVINGIFFLTAYPEEPRLQWPADAPESLTKKADEGKTHKEKRRAESKLFPMGYSRINYCFSRESHSSSNEPTGATKREHWRVGHWRHQPYGKKKALRKLNWIKPVLVNASGKNSDIPGHVYTVN